MENFVFQCATKTIFGRGAEEKVAEEIKRHGTRVLLHYGGGSVKKSGLYDRIAARLNEEGIYFVELGGVMPNPRVSLVREGIRLCRDNDLDFILAVGGGSVIDSSKAISIGVHYDGDVWDFYTKKAAINKNLPVGCVLTIPAAGSEMSENSVISDDVKQLKLAFASPLLRPKFALLNPELTYTLPKWQTSSGCMDIMAHVMERYFTPTKNVDFTDRLCEATLKTVIRNLPIVLQTPDDYDARAEIMWASSIAHNNLLGVGRLQDWGCHRIEHELSAIYDVTHGAGLAVVFPAWMKYVYKMDLNRFAQFAVRVWGVEMRYDPEETALEGIGKFKSFIKEAGLPTTLKELGIPDDDRFEEMGRKCTGDDTLPIGNFLRLTKQHVVNILNLAK